MSNSLSKEIAIKFKGLAIYQIAGGIIGLALIIGVITISRFLFLIFLIPIGLYLYSIYCGVLLLKNKKLGLKYSLLNQFLQLINFSIAGFAFQYISGLFISIGIDLSNSFNLKFNLGVSAWQTSINSANETFLINFNFVALFLVIFIDKLKRKIYEEEVEVELAQLGE